MEEDKTKKKMVKLGRYIFLRDILKFMSIPMVGISFGLLMATNYTNTLNQINPMGCKKCLAVGLVMGYISIELNKKIRSLRKDILKFKD